VKGRDRPTAFVGRFVYNQLKPADADGQRELAQTCLKLNEKEKTRVVTGLADALDAQTMIRDRSFSFPTIFLPTLPQTGEYMRFLRFWVSVGST
jgi:hypothetical protein